MQAALDVLDEADVDGLTVRAVAAKLDVKAAALYWHVRDNRTCSTRWRPKSGGRSPPNWRRCRPTCLDPAMTAFAGIMRRALLAHRDGAKVFSGTYLTDASVLKAQEDGLAALAAEGFAVRDVIRAFALLYNFTVGFCIEEQAVAQTAATGDDRYSLDRAPGGWTRTVTRTSSRPAAHLR